MPLLPSRRSVPWVLPLLAVTISSGFPDAARAGQKPKPPYTGAILGDPNRRHIVGRSGRHFFKVRLSQRPFRRERHRITQPDPGSRYRHWVDGRNAIGTDESIPHNELATFEVVVDGRMWPVPCRLWRDCYNPNLARQRGPYYGGSHVPEVAEYVFAWLSPDGQRLTVKMCGGDGAGSYRVFWYLRCDGRHTRRITYMD